jgi:hypothetical protein
MKGKLKISLFLLIAILTLNALAIPLAFSSLEIALVLPTEIYVDPANNIFDATTNGTIGTLFNVTMKVKNVDDMKTWQVGVYFNDSVINVTKWYEPKWDPKYVFYGKTTLSAPAPPTVAYKHISDGNGSAGVGSTLMPAPSPGGGFTGNGILCILTFNITATPSAGETYSCQLDISAPKYTYWIKVGETTKRPYDIYTNGEYQNSAPGLPYSVTIQAYCNTEGEEISVSIKKDGVLTGYNTPHTFTDLLGTHTFTVPITDPNGHPFKQWNTDETSNTITLSSSGTFTAYYESLGVGRIYVDPPEIIDPTLKPCQTFQVNITIDNIVNMAVCEFNLTYDTNIISWFGINLYKVQGQVPTASLNVDDATGYLWIKLIYKVPVTTATFVPLVKIEFHIQALGATPLDLHDTKILDPDGKEIPHDTIDGFFVTLIRDVAIVNVVPSRTWAYPGWPVNITITAKNLGNVSETFNVRAYYNENLIGTAPIVNLLPNTERNVIITWDTSGVPADVYQIKGEADTVPYETNTTNNIFVDGTVQILTVIRDVAITNVVPWRNWAYQGWMVKINVTAKNLGEVSETFDVKAYYDATTIGTIHVIDLAPDAEIKFTFTWNTSSVTPCHNYTITGEVTEVPYEYNATNNVYVDGKVKIRFLGDVNEDGRVDMADISMLIDAFLAFPGHPLWNPDADLNEDDVIDLSDISIAIDHFQEGC